MSLERPASFRRRPQVMTCSGEGRAIWLPQAAGSRQAQPVREALPLDLNDPDNPTVARNERQIGDLEQQPDSSQR